MLLPLAAGEFSGEVADREDLSLEEARELRLTDLFARAMNGQLVSGMNRKYWERKKLSPVHLRMIQMRAAGYRVGQIADHLDMTISNVSIVLNQEDSKFLLAELLSVGADEILDVRTRIKAYAGEMLDHVVEATRNTQSEKLRSENAFKLLNMAGYGAVAKTEVSVLARIEGEQAGKLVLALDEAMKLEMAEEVAADSPYVMLASTIEEEQLGETEDAVPEVPPEAQVA